MRQKRTKRTKPEIQHEPKVQITPHNEGQRLAIEAILNNDIIFLNGPPGSGKSYIAMGMAMKLLLEERYKGVVLTRPTVQQGKGIGFLPGSLEEKMGPYLIPLYDEIKKYLTSSELTGKFQVGVSSFKSSPIIQILPFEYMRGYSLINKILVADELQNATYEQIMMLITRLGANSKIIITGDISQRDCEIERGMEYFMDKLEGTKRIGIVDLLPDEIVRHPLIPVMLDRLK